MITTKIKSFKELTLFYPVDYLSRINSDEKTYAQYLDKDKLDIHRLAQGRLISLKKNESDNNVLSCILSDDGITKMQNINKFDSVKIAHDLMQLALSTKCANFKLRLIDYERLFGIPIVILTSENVLENNAFIDILSYYVACNVYNEMRVDQFCNDYVHNIIIVTKNIYELLLQSIEKYTGVSLSKTDYAPKPLDVSIFKNTGVGYYEDFPMIFIKRKSDTIHSDFLDICEFHITCSNNVKNVISSINDINHPDKTLSKEYDINTLHQLDSDCRIQSIRTYNDKVNDEIKPQVVIDESNTITINVNWMFGRDSLEAALQNGDLSFIITVIRKAK